MLSRCAPQYMCVCSCFPLQIRFRRWWWSSLRWSREQRPGCGWRAQTLAVRGCGTFTSMSSTPASSLAWYVCSHSLTLIPPYPIPTCLHPSAASWDTVMVCLNGSCAVTCPVCIADGDHGDEECRWYLAQLQTADHVGVLSFNHFSFFANIISVSLENVLLLM